MMMIKINFVLKNCISIFYRSCEFKSVNLLLTYAQKACKKQNTLIVNTVRIFTLFD